MEDIMKIPILLFVLSLTPFCYSQQNGSNTFVPTWQPKFNLYQTDTITNIKTTLQSKKYDALKRLKVTDNHFNHCQKFLDNAP